MQLLVAGLMYFSFNYAIAIQTSLIHGYGEALKGLSLDNVCITETDIKTIQPINQCAKLEPVVVGVGEDQRTELQCTKWIATHLSFSRTYDYLECEEYVKVDTAIYCKSSVKRVGFLPDTIQVNVITYNPDISSPGTTKHFTFPTCQ